MKQGGLAIVALIAMGGAWVWFSGLSHLAFFKEIVAMVVFVLVVSVIADLIPWSWPESRRSDGLIGFEAEVGSIEPLRVEAHGTVWRARVVDGEALQEGARVTIVGRDGLTLLVQARSTSRDAT